MNRMRLLIGLTTAATLVLLFVLARPGGDESATDTTETAALTRTTPPELEPVEPTETEPEPQPARMIVTTRDGRPVGGIARTNARKGDPVLIVVRSDTADHVHVHGYDLFADVGPGRPARMQFRAKLTGRFEIELEDSHRQIAQLTVVP